MSALTRRTAEAQALRTVGTTMDVAPVVSLVSARETLVDELTRTLHAERVAHLPPGWTATLRTLERRLGLDWIGPPPELLLVHDQGAGFTCAASEGQGRAACLGRLEALRLRSDADTSVATVILLASSAFLDHAVWEHELTHALLVQHGRVAESERHDPRYFARAR